MSLLTLSCALLSFNPFCLSPPFLHGSALELLYFPTLILSSLPFFFVLCYICILFSSTLYYLHSSSTLLLQYLSVYSRSRLYFLVSLLVVCGAALPLAGVVHPRRADGAGDEVGGAGGHEVSHCRRDVHPLVCHQVICSEQTKNLSNNKIKSAQVICLTEGNKMCQCVKTICWCNV